MRTLISAFLLLAALPLSAQNYDKAEFKFWLPPGDAPLQAIAVLVPGSNGDGRGQVDDAVWQAFAVKNRVALVGCRFTDKPHDQSFIEEYINVSKGSGQALIDAINAHAAESKHPELSTAPFLMWGMSAGGQFNYEFVAWKPERVKAFVVNKGGIYYSALLPKASRAVPGILFVGGKDLEFRTNTIAGLFAVNRRGGALWALAEEPAAGHIVGKSRDLAMLFYEDVLGGGTFSEKTGFIGDPKTKTVQPSTGAAPATPTSWLPSERVAAAWQEMATDSWQRDFSVAAADWASTGRNPYFVLEPGYTLEFAGGNERLTIKVLDETKTVAGVETRIVEERETKAGALVEVSRNYFAISKKTKDVYYFGEDVDMYTNGKITGHDGTWHAGVNGARFGLMMAAEPKLGDRSYQEVAPKIAMDRSEIVSLTEKVVTPAGTFINAVKVEETTPLEPGVKEYKWWAAGVGLIRTGDMKLVKRPKAQP
jgi:dienelactone hydrolase